MRFTRIAPLTVAILATAISAHAQTIEPVSVAPAETAQITLYQNGLGIVDEQRTAKIGAAGPTRLTLSGIAPAAVDGSAVIDTDALDIRRLVYRLQPLNARLMLERAIGGTVTRVRVHPETGAESFETVNLLGLDGGLAIIERDGLVELVGPSVLAFGTPDADLLERPAIDVAGHALGPGSRTLGLRYLVGNVGWKTDYVIAATGSEAAPSLDITGWASVRNGSGRAFTAKPLMLVAGDVNRTSPEPMPRAEMADARMMSMAMDAAPKAERVAAGDVHVYSLVGPVMLAANETTQVRLAHQPGVKAERRYIVEGGGYLLRSPMPGMQPFENPAVEIRFSNEGTEPLPAGNARVYADGRLLGESAIPATPAGEQVTLRTGQAFDLTVRRQQTAFRRLGPPDNAIETAHELSFRNAKSEAVEIEVREQIGGEWDLIEASQPMNRDGLTAVWRIAVPAGGEASLTYVVRVKR